jgi:hypothetical protein
MAIKRRSGKIGKDVYVFIDATYGLQIKTPAPCIRWDHDFRLRIVRDYVPPKTLRSFSEHKSLTARANNPDTTYKVAGKQLQVRHPSQTITDKNYVVVLRTDILNLTDGKQLYLCHEDPAMRILMVYSFLTGIVFGGVPDLQIADYIQE